MKGRIGFDIDGVLADFSQGLYTVLKEKGHELPSIHVLSNTFYWEHSIPKSASEIEKVFDKTNNDFWEGLPPVNDGKDFELLSKFIIENKDNVYFITSRPSHLLRSTKKWLGENLKLDNINIVMGAQSKACICRGLGLRAYIDDRFLFSYEIAKKSKTRSFMLSNISNYEFGDTYRHGVYRVGSIAEYINEVNQ